MTTTWNQSLPANYCDAIQPSSVFAQSLVTSAAPVRQLGLRLRILAASAIAIFIAWSAPAATRFVDLSGVAPNDGTAWATAYTNLQDALAVASSGDQIWVAQGTYYPDEGGTATPDDRDATFNLIDVVALYGGFPTGGGDGTFAARAYTAYPSILSGDLLQDDGPDFTNRADNARHVLTANSNVTTAAILDGFTITAGYHARAEFFGPPGLGGGLLCRSASPSFANCSFLGNFAQWGGAIYSNDSSPSFVNCSFLGNFADQGGAIYKSDSSPSLDNCSFLGNTVHQRGGAVYSYNSSSPLTNCSFEGNSANEGGGMFNVGSSPTLTDCIFNDNSARDQGGAIYNTAGDTGYSSPTLDNCFFQGNSAASAGGAIRNEGSSSLTLAHCTFQGNSATTDYCGSGQTQGATPSYGGAISSERDSSTSLTYCSFSENTAGCRGGAIHLAFSSLTAVSYCSFSGNSARNGGAIHSESSSPTFANCSFVGNSASASDIGPSTGGAVSMRGAPSDVFVNCLFQGNSAANGGGLSIPSTGNSVALYNCTLTGNTASNLGGGAYGGTFYNCIFYFNSAPLGANYHGDGNNPISLNYSCTTPLPTNGVGNITNAPLFVDTDGWSDLHLRYGSPGIDAGTNLSALLTTDLDGNPRPLDGDGDGTSAFDMGAYEFDARSILPPDWFTRHGLDANDPHVVSGNPDHDPFTTFQEWLAGTDPTNALSFFHIEAIGKESPATVLFLSSSNRTYTLWSTPEWVSPDWAVVPGQENVPGNGGTLTLSDPTNALRQFYRVEVSRP